MIFYCTKGGFFHIETSSVHHAWNMHSHIALKAGTDLSSKGGHCRMLPESSLKQLFPENTAFGISCM